MHRRIVTFDGSGNRRAIRNNCVKMIFDTVAEGSYEFTKNKARL